MKSVGDIGELKFILRAKKSGLTVSTPYSSISPYDSITEFNGKLNKIQVKTTATKVKSGDNLCYKLSCGKGTTGKKKYTSREVDYFAFFITEIDLFYIVPLKEITSITIRIYPNKKDHKFNKYLEAFDLLK